MKYFTYDLWCDINSSCKEEQDKADLQWNENLVAYWKHFEEIKDRLPAPFLKTYFDHGCFHDFKLANISTTNLAYGKKNPIWLHIDIENDGITYRIIYKKVKKILIDFNETDHTEGRRGFDDWGYSEFLPVDDKTLQHEILFASGATVLVQFQNKSIQIKRLAQKPSPKIIPNTTQTRNSSSSDTSC